MTTYTLPRTGDSPVRFDGVLLAESGSQWFEGRECNRWHELQLFRANTGDDRLWIAHVAFRTRWQGEASRDDVLVASSPAELRRILRDHEPVHDRVGSPQPAHADRQARLVAAIREQYAACVSAVLAGDDFACAPEVAESRPRVADRVGRNEVAAGDERMMWRLSNRQVKELSNGKVIRLAVLSPLHEIDDLPSWIAACVAIPEGVTISDADQVLIRVNPPTLAKAEGGMAQVLGTLLHEDTPSPGVEMLVDAVVFSLSARTRPRGQLPTQWPGSVQLDDGRTLP